MTEKVGTPIKSTVDRKNRCHYMLEVGKSNFVTLRSTVRCFSHDLQFFPRNSGQHLFVLFVVLEPIITRISLLVSHSMLRYTSTHDGKCYSLRPWNTSDSHQTCLITWSWASLTIIALRLVVTRLRFTDDNATKHFCQMHCTLELLINYPEILIYKRFASVAIEVRREL